MNVFQYHTSGHLKYEGEGVHEESVSAIGVESGEDKIDHTSMSNPKPSFHRL